jgi:hypothetical protein
MYMMWKINCITMHNSIYKIESNIFCLFSYIILTNSMNWFAYLGKENRCTWCGKKILHYNAIYIYIDKIPQWIKKYCITMQGIYILTKYLNELICIFNFLCPRSSYVTIFWVHFRLSFNRGSWPATKIYNN